MCIMERGSISPSQQQHTSMSNCRQTWRMQTMYCLKTNTWINPCSCLCIVKLLVVGVLTARLCLHSCSCSHGKSDQSKSTSGSMILLPPQTHLTSECSFYVFHDFIEPMSEVQLNFGSLQHIINWFGPEQINRCECENKNPTTKNFCFWCAPVD